MEDRSSSVVVRKIASAPFYNIPFPLFLKSLGVKNVTKCEFIFNAKSYRYYMIRVYVLVVFSLRASLFLFFLLCNASHNISIEIKSTSRF